MDEIDAIGGRRFSEGTSAGPEIQRTLMELLNQLDGFDVLGKVKLNYFNMLIFVYNCKSLGILMQSANSHGGCQYYCNIMLFAIVTSQVCKITRYY
jgi:hypothetical protein